MHPFNLRIKGKKLLFLGGGAVAERKILSLLPNSPVITVISPDITEKIEALAKEHLLKVHKRKATVDDINESYFIVFACTDDSCVNRKAATRCEELRVLANIADDGEISDIHMTASFQHNDVIISISSVNGQNPKKSKELKEKLKVFLASGSEGR